MDGCGGHISTLAAAAGQRVQHRAERGELRVVLGLLPGERLVQVGGGHGGRVTRGHPDAADHADRRAGRQPQRPGDILGRLTARDVPGLAGDRAAHRIQPGTEPGRPLDRNPVVGRAGPVQLPVGQLPDERAAGQVTERGVDLGQADVVPPGQCGAPGQSPARFPVHERRRHPVREHRDGSRRGSRSGVIRRRGRLRGDRMVAPGGAGRHRSHRDRAAISPPVTESSMRTKRTGPFPLVADHALTGGITWRDAGAANGSIAPAPFPASSANVALTRLQPTRGRHDRACPCPLIFTAGERKLNIRGTNRRLLDVI